MKFYFSVRQLPEIARLSEQERLTVLTHFRLYRTSPLKFRFAEIGFVAFVILGCASDRTTQRTKPDESMTDGIVQAVFSELRMLQPMKAGQHYTVPVGGEKESGLKERFLRRRSVAEIRASRLSSGCGDYALVFIDEIERRGFNTMLVEGVEISSGSLQSRFSGHAVVAIREIAVPAEDSWWLVDPTHLKILSRDWASTNKHFDAFGGFFWIGYSGPLEEYAVRSPEDLKLFYTQTLAKVPREVINSVIPRLKFTVHSSLKGEGDGFLNPQLPVFAQLQPSILTAHGVEPHREVSILLTSGGDNALSHLSFSAGVGWVCYLGLRSGCSPSLLSYFERTIRDTELTKPK